MHTIHDLIRTKADAWVKLEQQNNQSLITHLLKYIEQTGQMRLPQRQAIEIYLWIKFVGGNKKLSDLIKSGLLFDRALTIALAQEGYRIIDGDYVTQFLNHFFQDNRLNRLHTELLNDPGGKETNWHEFLENLLHNFSYPNYLYSLPMGAGKTYLMASFIYLDLYFATLFRQDKRFAHNFVIFAPHASKTAILPALKTIKNFNPEWILPKAEADKIRQVITIEILDSLSSKRRDKLHGNNPNLEKVNRLKQTKDLGIVLITNAEKVVLERYDDKDKIAVQNIKEGRGDFLDGRTLSDIEKTNELREALSQLPQLAVILDEVHHAYGKTTDAAEKKLRTAVSTLNQHGNINAVIGLSGTPYAKTAIQISEENIIRLNQIQDIVYNYPLHTGIGKFLKKPEIKRVGVKESTFIQQALSDFFSDYDTTYSNGTTSKIAFYCPTIEKLNEEILPEVKQWYEQNRPKHQQEIFRYYTNVSKNNKQYALPKDSLAIFNNLDKPYSKVRVILLVAVGTEGWDCKSLTAVVLPRTETSKNFVLQTTCRCLREVTDASQEKALIYLNPDNYLKLDKELKESYNLSISDLTFQKEQTMEVQVRKPKLGQLKYKQIAIRYKIVKQTSPDIKKAFHAFKFDAIKKEHPADSSITTGQIGKRGLTSEIKEANIYDEAVADWAFEDFLYGLAAATYGKINESELYRGYKKELTAIYKQIAQSINWQWIATHPTLTLRDVYLSIAGSIMDTVEYTKEVIERQTEIELLEWEGDNNEINITSPDGRVFKIMPKILARDLLGRRGYANHPEYIEEDFFGQAGNCDPQDISYNYVPYRMDSTFEQNALEAMLKLSELKNLEIYFNGYKDQRLQSFWIQTPRGRYTPDFLIVRRADNKKYKKGQTIPISKAFIIETKGKIYYNNEFKAKEKFVKKEFLKHNKHFKYHCFIDEGSNNFNQHLDKLIQLLQEF